MQDADPRVLDHILDHTRVHVHARQSLQRLVVALDERNEGAFITIAEGAAGLKFTPTTNSAAAGQFTIQASTSNIDAGLGGATATATITVDRLASFAAVETSGSPSNQGQSVTFDTGQGPKGPRGENVRLA